MTDGDDRELQDWFACCCLNSPVRQKGSPHCP